MLLWNFSTAADDSASKRTKADDNDMLNSEQREKSINDHKPICTTDF